MPSLSMAQNVTEEGAGVRLKSECCLKKSMQDKRLHKIRNICNTLACQLSVPDNGIPPSTPVSFVAFVDKGESVRTPRKHAIQGNRKRDLRLGIPAVNRRMEGILLT